MMTGFITEIDCITGTGIVEIMPSFTRIRFSLSDAQENIEKGQVVNFEEGLRPLNIRCAGNQKIEKSIEIGNGFSSEVQALGPEEAEIQIAVPFGGRLVSPEWSVALANMEKPLSTGFLAVKGQKIIDARNLLVKKAQETKAKYLFFVDDDIEPPSNCLNLLLDALQTTNCMVAVGLCGFRRKNSPAMTYTNIGFLEWEKDKIQEIKRTGTGCMLIKMEVFNKIDVPYFDGSEQSLTKFQTVGEDFYFCDKVRNAGYKIVAHGGVVCKHRDSLTGIAHSPVQKDAWDLGFNNGAFESL